MKILGFFSLLIINISSYSAGLTLTEAITTALQNDSTIKQLRSQITKQQNTTNSLNDMSITLSANLERKDRFDETIDNSVYALSFKKPLFDETSNAAIASADEEIAIIQHKLKEAKLSKTLEVMRAFFAIMIADSDYHYLAEELAVFAVSENKIKDYMEAGRYSEVELLEKSAQTQESLVRMRAAENTQLTTRMYLASVMSLPLSEEITDITPFDAQKYLDIDLDTFRTWQDKILAGNITLQALQQKLSNINSQLQRAETDNALSVNLYGKLYRTAFDSEKNGNYLAGIELSMPLYSGSDEATIANLAIDSEQQQTTIEDYKRQISAKGLELWLKIKNLLQEKKSLQVVFDYKDLYLERARARYELELTSDIGNAMAEYTKTEKLVLQNKLDIVLAMQQLMGLTGESYVK